VEVAALLNPLLPEEINALILRMLDKDFWNHVVFFVSKDENLTKAHVRYLESRLLIEATQVGRFMLEQNQAGGSKLPESDREDMEVFLFRIRQLLPVLGSDLLIPIAQPKAKQQSGGTLFCRMKGAEGRGHRTPDGFVMNFKAFGTITTTGGSDAHQSGSPSGAACAFSVSRRPSIRTTTRTIDMKQSARIPFGQGVFRAFMAVLL